MGMIKFQGTQLIINAFFNTIVNSAIAVANFVNQFIQMFAFNISKSIAPQIYKSYAANDEDRYTYLVCLASRMTYMVMLMVALPFLLIPETLFGLWLKEIPDGTLLFSRLMIVDILIISLNSGITDIIFASGKIYTYQIIVSSLTGISVVAGFFTVKMGFGSESLLYCYILFSFITFLIRPFILLHEINFKIYTLIKDSYIPVFLVSILTTPVFLLPQYVNAWGAVTIAMLWYLATVWIVGFNKNERASILCKIKDYL